MIRGRRTRILGVMATAGLLAVELLAVAVPPAAATGEASLTIVFTGNGSGAAVTSDGHIDCAYTNGVIVTNRCSRAGYSLFTKVTLTVTANTGSALCDNDFVCHAEGETNVYTISLSGPITWNGFLGLQNRYLTVIKSGAGAGSITSTDGKVSCPVGCQSAQVGYTYGDAVTLHAAAAAGSVFDHWTGTCVGTASTCALTMTSPDNEAATTAVFKLKAVATPGPTHTVVPGHTAAPAHTAAPGQTQPNSTTLPAATASAPDPGTSGAPTASDVGAVPTSGADPSPSPGSVATPGLVTPSSTPGSLDTGWIAFLLLLVLVLGVSVGGAIAFVAMRRRAPPPAT